MAEKHPVTVMEKLSSQTQRKGVSLVLKASQELLLDSWTP